MPAKVGNKSARTHGKSGTPICMAWGARSSDASNPNASHYSDYGGREITVCKRWLDSFEAFHADMSPIWFLGVALDRYPNKTTSL